MCAVTKADIRAFGFGLPINEFDHCGNSWKLNKKSPADVRGFRS